jgi:hypothetical protein
MITDQREGSEVGVTKLVGGIIEDVQELFKSQLELFHSEIKDDLRRTKEASTLLVAAGLVLMLGGIFLGLMLVYLLHEMVGLPLWGSFGIVGGVFAALGVIFYVVGKDRFASFNPLPDKSVEAMKENLQWTNPKNSK